MGIFSNLFYKVDIFSNAIQMTQSELYKMHMHGNKRITLEAQYIIHKHTPSIFLQIYGVIYMEKYTSQHFHPSPTTLNSYHYNQCSKSKFKIK